MSQKFERQVRKLAKGLPVVYIYRPVVNHVPGKELLKTRTHVDGKPIHPDVVYMVKASVPVAVNHVNRIKEVHKLQGDTGVAVYIRQARIESKKQQQQLAGKHGISKSSLWKQFKAWIKKIVNEYLNK